MCDMLDNKIEYRILYMSKLKSRKKNTMSTEESLKDIIPINWNDEVLNGKKKVIIRKQK